MAPDRPDLQATTYPDLAHERLRQELLDHIEQLADSFLIGQTAADFAQTVLTNFISSRALLNALAAANPRVVNDGVTTTGGTTVTSASAQFAPYDQGRAISGGSLPAGTTITTVTDAQTVTVSQAAGADGTGVALTIGAP